MPAWNVRGLSDMLRRDAATTWARLYLTTFPPSSMVSSVAAKPKLMRKQTHDCIDLPRHVYTPLRQRDSVVSPGLMACPATHRAPVCRGQGYEENRNAKDEDEIVS